MVFSTCFLDLLEARRSERPAEDRTLELLAPWCSQFFEIGIRRSRRNFVELLVQIPAPQCHSRSQRKTTVRSSSFSSQQFNHIFTTVLSLARLGPCRQKTTTFCTGRISIARCCQRQVQVDPAEQLCLVPVEAGRSSGSG